MLRKIIITLAVVSALVPLPRAGADQGGRPHYFTEGWIYLRIDPDTGQPFFGDDWNKAHGTVTSADGTAVCGFPLSWGIRWLILDQYTMKAPGDRDVRIYNLSSAESYNFYELPPGVHVEILAPDPEHWQGFDAEGYPIAPYYARTSHIFSTNP